MPERRLVPDPLLIKWRLVDKLTLEQIRQESYKITGVMVTKSGVSRALARLKMTTPRVKYTDTLPWVLEDDHRKSHIAQMLQAQGRRARGLELRPAVAKNLASWERKLIKADAVVDYVPDSIENIDGFIYRRRKPEDGDGWVRRPAGEAVPEPVEENRKPEQPMKVPVQTRSHLSLVSDAS